MKIFILLLIISAFLQTSFVPINLILLLIIARTLINPEQANYYIAFFAGILLGVLSTENLGFWPLVLLIVVKLTNIIQKLPLSSSVFFILPIVGIFSIGISLIEQLLYGQTFEFKFIIFEIILSIPIYLLVKLLEDRFVVRSDVRLKLRK